ncbi:hypothetical protein P3T43_000828 [Paraburkholderia sp. GAS41]|jgi:hypothetical protein|uniref:hypothetical protein n=1 Tax=Paraburkholderia sp. GAS41 TaxID=3035134 RepID=UPI003D1DE95E
MTTAAGSAYAMYTSTPASLRELANYLELALDAGQAVVVMRYGTSQRSVYIGDPENSLDTLSSSDAVAAHLAEEMLALTAPGMNRITADGQVYRFTRTHRYIEDRQAVIFAPA